MVPELAPGTDAELRAELEAVRDRLDALEDEHRRLLNTVTALAREGKSAVCGPCTQCDEAYLLLANQQLYCPTCRDSRPM